MALQGREHGTETLRDSFLWLDEDGVVVRAEGVSGSSTGPVGRALEDLVHPDDRERILERLDHRSPGSEGETGPVAVEFRLEAGNGWRAIRGSAVAVEGGWLLGCRASSGPSSRDEDLRAELQKYRLLFHQSPVGVLHYDTDLRVSDVNESLCRILQSPRDTLVGLDMRKLQDQRVLPALEAPLRGEEGRYEGQYRATYSSAEIWVFLRTVPFHDADGRVRGGIGIVEDVTERKEGEQVQRALYRLSEAVHVAEDLPALFETIHRILGRLMPARNIYLALHDEESRSVRFPYFVDERDDPPEGSIPTGRGVTEYVLRTEEALLAGPEELEALREAGEVELRGALPASWLGVPLKVGQKTTGVLALQSYDPEVRFGERERSVLTFVAEQVAMAVERKRNEAQIARMAYYDLLTSLPNRRMLQEKAPHFLAIGRRKSWPVSLLYLDLDRFKNINDTLGHDAGDQLLVEIARELERCARTSDLLGRLGGDEFAFVMSDAGPQEASRLARRVGEVLDRPFVVRDERVHVGCSMGIAVFPEHGDTLEELLKHADIAMYRAKDAGIDFSVFDSERSPYSRERLALEAELREAVSRAELVLHYQPVFRVADGSRTGVEALIRWPREEQEVPAPELVSLAEESDLIRTLDRFVLGRALRDFQGVAAGAGAELELSLNLSPASLHQEGLTESLVGLLDETGIDPSRVVLEVTESAALRNPESSRRTLRALADVGLRIAMDDFGSGFSSVTHLRNMPFRRLKIDRSLVTAIGTSSRGEQLVEGTILMGQSLGMEIVAEGVETEEQLEWLRERRCDLVQGFLLGRPMPLEEVFGS